jgi:hypothetical protein
MHAVRDQGRALRRCHRPASTVLAALPLLALLALLVAAPSCDGGKESGDAEGGGKKTAKTKASSRAASADDWERYQEEYADLLEGLTGSGAGKLVADAVQRAKKLNSEAEDLVADGEPKKAVTKWKLAAQKLKEAATAQEKVGAARTKAEAAKTEAEAARTAAEGADVARNAPALAQQASELLASGAKGLEEGTLASLEKAYSSFSQAKLIYEQAKDLAGTNREFRDAAEAEAAVLAQWKAQAEKVSANTKALEEWVSATQAERQAELHLKTGRFSDALQGYQQAQRLFTRAIESVATDAEIGAAEAAAEAARVAYASQAAAQAEKDRELERQRIEVLRGERRTEATPPPQEGGSGTSGAATAAARRAFKGILDDFNPEACPQTLPADEEAFLLKHVNKLSVLMSYDPGSNMVYLDYASGKDLRKEIGEQARPLVAKKYLSFFDPLDQANRGARGTPDPTDPTSTAGSAEKPKTPYSFAGNTEGLLMFPVPFRCRVKIEYDMQILTMDLNGSFNVMNMFDPREMSGYITDFIHIGTMARGNRTLKRLPGQYSQSANRWFEKKREVPMLHEYRMPNPEAKEGGPTGSGLLTCVYDVDETGEVNKLDTKAYEAGLVGFQWHRVKFEVRKLRVTGVLDKKKAVEILAARPDLKAEWEEIQKAKEEEKKKKKETEAETAQPEDEEEDRGRGEETAKESAVESGKEGKKGTKKKVDEVDF